MRRNKNRWVAPKAYILINLQSTMVAMVVNFNIVL